MAGVCCLLFAWLTAAVVAGRTLAWDTRTLIAVAGSQRPWLTEVMRVTSVLGSGAVEIPVALLLALWLSLRGRRSEASGYAAAALSGWALYGLAKYLVHRPRPHVVPHLMPDAGWYSYPSGHSALAPLVFGLGALVLASPWSSRAARVGILALAVLLTLAIACSRVYLGVHWPTDVAGGLLLGTAWAAGWVSWWERAPGDRDQAAS